MAIGDISALNQSAEWRETKSGLTFKGYATAPTLVNKLIPAEGQNAIEVGGRAHRVVVETMRSLAGGVVNLDGGAVTNAAGLRSTEYYVGTYPFMGAASITKAQELLGGSEEVTVGASQLQARTIGYLGEAYAMLETVFYHMDDTGILAGGTTGASAVNVGAGTMTFADANDPRRNYLLLPGMTVEVFDLTLATRRVPPDTSRPTIVIANDTETGVVTLANLPAATVATDMLLIPGLIAPVPASGFHAGFATGTLTTTPANAATPASATVSGPAAMGWGGQPWRKGLKYFTESNGNRYFFNLQRSSIPYLKPTGVDASAAALSFTSLTNLRDTLIQKTNQSFKPGDFVAITHHRQRTKLEATQVVSPISSGYRILSDATGVGPIKDPVPSGGGDPNMPFRVMDVDVYMSPMWHPKHFGMFYKPQENLGRVWAPGGKPAPFSLGGRDTFEGRDAYGIVRTYFSKYIMSVGDLWAKDTSCFGEIYNLL